MESLRIKSAPDAFELILGPPEGRRGEGSFPARLAGLEMSVSVNAYEHSYHHLAGFFENLAANWRGWAGEKTWKSAESHVELMATTDGLGHVYLHARLGNIIDPANWHAEATLLIEAGQLDGLAASARRVFAADAAP